MALLCDWPDLLNERLSISIFGKRFRFPLSNSADQLPVQTPRLEIEVERYSWSLALPVALGMSREEQDYEA